METPRANTYPEFVEGDDWTPGRIPPQVRSPEYRADAARDLSSDTEASLTMRAVTLDGPPAMETAAKDVRRVELTPLPGIEQGADLEKEIQRRIQQESHRLVKDVLRRSAGLARPPPSSESARAALGACLERALAPTGPSAQPTQSAPPPPTVPELSLTDPFVGINPPPPAMLTEASARLGPSLPVDVLSPGEPIPPERRGVATPVNAKKLRPKEDGSPRCAQHGTSPTLGAVEPCSPLPLRPLAGTPARRQDRNISPKDNVHAQSPYRTLRNARQS